jgi:hypothetical protein
LLVERGLSVAVARGYADSVRPFVVGVVEAGGVRPGRVTAGAVSDFLVAQAGRVTPKTLQRTATALRSLLRFWRNGGSGAESNERSHMANLTESCGVPRIAPASMPP